MSKDNASADVKAAEVSPEALAAARAAIAEEEAAAARAARAAAFAEQEEQKEAAAAAAAELAEKMPMAIAFAEEFLACVQDRDATRLAHLLLKL